MGGVGQKEDHRAIRGRNSEERSDEGLTSESNQEITRKYNEGVFLRKVENFSEKTASCDAKGKGTGQRRGE